MADPDSAHDPSEEKPALVERVRSAGPAGFIYVGALVAAGLLSAGESEPVTTTAAPTTVALAEPDVADPGERDRDGFRESIEEFGQCLRNDEIPARLARASPDLVELRVRPGTLLDDLVEIPGYASCFESHLGQYEGLSVGLVDEFDGEIPSTTLLESTDSTTFFDPTTDTTQP